MEDVESIMSHEMHVAACNAAPSFFSSIIDTWNGFDVLIWIAKDFTYAQIQIYFAG